MSLRHNLSFCACKSAWFALEWQVYKGSSTHLCFFPCKTATLWPDIQVCMGPRSHLWSWADIRVLSTRIKRLYGFQPSPVVLCMQNSNFSTWITSLYGSQPSSEVFACKPAAFGPKLHVSMGTRTHPWFSACKTACLASELLVSMGPSPHLWFCMQNSDFWTRIANLYGSQISPAVLFLQCSVSSIRIISLHGSQPSCVIFGCNRVTFGPEKQVSISPRHNLSLCACKIAWLAPELLVSMCPNLHL